MTVLSTVLGILVGTGSASAHAVLISTDPGQGAVIAAVPAAVSLTFSEPVVVAADGVRVFGPEGTEVDSGHALHLGRSSTVGVGLRDSAGVGLQGTYTVSWRVISADSHPVSGAFTFSVGHPSPSRAETARPSGSTAVGVVYAIVRAAAFACFALLVGSIGFVLLCWPGAIARRDVRSIMLVGWAGLLVASIATLLLQGPYGNGLGFDRLFDSTTVEQTLNSRLGVALTARLALLALAAAYLVLLCAWLGHMTRRGRLWCGVLGLGLALTLACTWAAAGHAAVGLQPALALPLDVLHLVAMGLWLGGLVTLAVALRPAAATNAEVSSDPQHAVHRFSPIATGLIVILIGTGSYQSWRQLGSWAAFESTDYGRLLLIKLAAFALMLTAALRSRRTARECVTVLWHSMPLTSALRRSVLREAALGALVLGVTSMLVNAEPGRTATELVPGIIRGSTHHTVSYDTGGPNGRGELVVDVDPAATGPNTIRVTVEDSRGILQEVAELHTNLTLPAQQLGPFAIAFDHTAPGRYVARGVQLPFRGTWQLRATVRTSDIDETTVATPIDIR